MSEKNPFFQCHHVLSYCCPFLLSDIHLLDGMPKVKIIINLALELPFFSMREWLYRVEQLLDFITYKLIKESEWPLSTLRMGPLQRYRWLLYNHGGYLNWWEFERGLISLYDRSSSRMIDFSGELMKLKQGGGTYDDY